MRVNKKLLDIGYGSVINPDRLIAAVPADAAPIRRVVSAAKERGMAIDATCGKKTRTVFVMDSGHCVLSAKTAGSFAMSGTGEDNS